MSRADKRACVEWLLDNGGKMTRADVAAKAGVSLRLVRYIVAERKSDRVQIAPSDDSERDVKKAQNAPFAPDDPPPEPPDTPEGPNGRAEGREYEDDPFDEPPAPKKPPKPTAPPGSSSGTSNLAP